MSEQAKEFRPWMEALPEGLKLPPGVFAPQEEWAWERLARGQIADMALFDPQAERGAKEWWRGKPGASPPDPKDAGTFNDHHILSERFLRTVIFHEPYASGAERPGVRVQNAWVKDAINWSGRTARGGLWLDRCRFENDVIVQDLTVPSLLSLQGAAFKGALSADRLETGGGLFCRDGFIAEGDVRLLGAKIGGQAAFIGATLKGALAADGLKTGGGLFCDGFTAEAEVRLLGAKIGGAASFIGATLKGALSADRLETGGDLFCRNGFTAEAEVRLLGAKIGGVASFIGATLKGTLTADGLETGGSLFCRDGFSAEGEVRLLGAKIGSSVSFIGATLKGALKADRLETGGALFLRKMRLGAANLIGARIGGNVQLRLSTLDGVIDFTGARIDGALELAQGPGSEPIWNEGAGLILRNVNCGALAGHLGAFRRERKGKARKGHFPKLDLVGLRYSNLGGLGAEQKDTLAGVKDVKELIAFLEAGAGDGATFTPGPYRQLAKELRESGHAAMARGVLRAMAGHERKTAPLPRRAELFFAGMLTGYGHRNFYALLWFLTLAAGMTGFGLWATGAQFAPSLDGAAHVGRWAWFSLGNATPIITLDDAHKTFLADQFDTAPNAVPLGAASAFYAAKILGFVILSYYVASLTGLANRSKD